LGIIRGVDGQRGEFLFEEGEQMEIYYILRKGKGKEK